MHKNNANEAVVDNFMNVPETGALLALAVTPPSRACPWYPSRAITKPNNAVTKNLIVCSPLKF